MYTQSTFAETVLLRGCHEEPSLDDMLSDPIVHLLMGSDGVQPADVRRALFSAMQRRLAA
jgi:hypothetical protein